MDESIITFLKQQTVATIAICEEDGTPYCYNSFYAFDSNSSTLIIKSSLSTHHGQLLKSGKNRNVAGTIVMDALDKIMIQGVQFKGTIRKNDLFDVKAAMFYHGTHPMAVAVPGELWTIELSWIKMTDNTRGFGTKLVWNRESNI